MGKSAKNMKFVHKAPVDLVMDSLVMNLVYSLHQAMRQGQGQKASAYTRFNQVVTHTVTAHGKSLSISTAGLITIYQAVQAETGFLDTNKHEWAGNVQTVISLWLLFYERLKEARITPTQLTIGKETAGNLTKVKSISLADLGVLPQIRQFCTGINYRPFMRGALAQTLGPITQVLLLIHSQGMYTNGWRAAVKRAFAYVPHIDQIVEFLANAQNRNCGEIVTQSCNIAMLAGGREQRRISLPPYYLYFEMGETVTSTVTKEEFVFDEAFAEVADFSGAGA